jgi:regulatory protein
MSKQTSKNEETAFNRAARFLSYGSRSVNEVRRYLCDKGLSDFQDTVIERLTNAGLLDDECLVESWILQRADLKSLGRIRIRVELLKKGIDPQLINSKLDQFYDPEMEKLRALNAASRRINQLKDLAPETVNRRIYSYLKNKGFEDSAIREAIERISNP